MDTSIENKIDMLVQSIAIINNRIESISNEQELIKTKIDELKDQAKKDTSSIKQEMKALIDENVSVLTQKQDESTQQINQCLEDLTNLSIFISSLQNQISEVVEYISGEPYKGLVSDINKSLDRNQNVITTLVNSLDENVLLCVEYFRNSINTTQEQNKLLANLQTEIRQSIDELIIKASSMTDASVNLKNVVTESASLVTAIESAVLSITALVQTTVDKIQTIQGNIADMNELSRNILSSVKFENTASQIISSLRDLTIAGNQFKNLFSREEEKI